jgi:hypothetical protein
MCSSAFHWINNRYEKYMFRQKPTLSGYKTGRRVDRSKVMCEAETKRCSDSSTINVPKASNHTTLLQTLKLGRCSRLSDRLGRGGSLRNRNRNRGCTGDEVVAFTYTSAPFSNVQSYQCEPVQDASNSDFSSRPSTVQLVQRCLST